MGERTGISWTDHTLNPWTRCTKVRRVRALAEGRLVRETAEEWAAVAPSGHHEKRGSRSSVEDYIAAHPVQRKGYLRAVHVRVTRIRRARAT